MAARRGRLSGLFAALAIAVAGCGASGTSTATAVGPPPSVEPPPSDFAAPTRVPRAGDVAVKASSASEPGATTTSMAAPTTTEAVVSAAEAPEPERHLERSDNRGTVVCSADDEDQGVGSATQMENAPERVRFYAYVTPSEGCSTAVASVWIHNTSGRTITFPRGHLEIRMSVHHDGEAMEPMHLQAPDITAVPPDGTVDASWDVFLGGTGTYEWGAVTEILLT